MSTLQPIATPSDGRLEPWKLHLGFWVVMGTALFLSGLSQGPWFVSVVRNAYLLAAGFLAGFFLSWLLSRVNARPLRVRLGLALSLSVLLGFLIIVVINPITFGQFGVPVGELTMGHLFAGAMNYSLVLSLWGVLHLLYEERTTRAVAAPEAPAGEPGEELHAAPLVVESRGIARTIELDAIEYLEAAGDYVRIHTAGESFLERTTLSKRIESLPAERFLRIHRSRVVNARKVRALEPRSKGSLAVVLDGGVCLRSSRGYRAAIEARFRRP